MSPRDPLDELLRETPRVVASPEFTGRVLAALDRQPRRSRHRRRAAIACALAGALALTAAGVVGWRGAGERQQARAAEAAALEAEARALARELASLRTLAAASSPVLYLGESGEVDLVLDLGALWEASLAGGPAAAVAVPRGVATPRSANTGKGDPR